MIDDRLLLFRDTILNSEDNRKADVDNNTPGITFRFYRIFRLFFSRFHRKCGIWEHDRYARIVFR